MFQILKAREEITALGQVEDNILKELRDTNKYLGALTRLMFLDSLAEEGLISFDNYIEQLIRDANRIGFKIDPQKYLVV